MDRTFALFGACFAFVAVALGAFGAHALAGRLDTRALEVFEIGVRYQSIHALALLFVSLLLAHRPGPLGTWAGWAFVVGILVFSGSLYLLALTGVGRWGAVTPLGGVAFLAGWVLVIAHLARS